jgi:hypothetical protein
MTTTFQTFQAMESQNLQEPPSLLKKRIPKRALHRMSNGIQPFGAEKNSHMKGIEVPGRIEFTSSTQHKTEQTETGHLLYCTSYKEGDDATGGSSNGGKGVQTEEKVPEVRTLGWRFKNEEALKQLALKKEEDLLNPVETKIRPKDTFRIVNLSAETLEIDLMMLLQKHGRCSRLYIARDNRDRENPIPKGFAVVSFSSVTEASSAFESIENTPWDSFVLHTEWVC